MSKTATMPKRTVASPKAPKGVALLLVDDHPMWRDTLRNILTHAKVGKVVGEASDGAEAVALAGKLRPDVIVMDVNLPEMDGIEATRRLIAQASGAKVLVLASSDERTQVIEAVRAGASGYVLKTAAPDEVVEAVRRVSKGELVFPPSVADAVLGELREEVTPGLRVVVGDEELIAREGLTRVLDEAGFDVVRATGDVDDLIEAIGSDPPDVAIIDGAMAAAISQKAPQIAVLVLASELEAGEAEELLESAARGIGYMLKERIANVDDLSDAVRRVARGESVVDPQVVSRLVRRPKKARALDKLTSREREVLALMAEGHSNQAIVDRLFLGPKTVEAHVRSIFSKLGLDLSSDVHRRVLAVITYLRST